MQSNSTNKITPSYHEFKRPINMLISFNNIAGAANFFNKRLAWLVLQLTSGVRSLRYAPEVLGVTALIDPAALK